MKDNLLQLILDYAEYRESMGYFADPDKSEWRSAKYQAEESFKKIILLLYEVKKALS